MKELLTYIVQSLVDHPDEVSVTEHKVDGETVLEVRVADGDMGSSLQWMPQLYRSQDKHPSPHLRELHSTRYTGDKSAH